MGEKKVVVYTSGFRKAFVAEGASGIGKGSSIEGFLNSESGDRITLENANCFVLEKGVYVPADHPEGSPTLNTDLISFIYGSPEILYKKDDQVGRKNQVSLLWDFNHPAGSHYSHRIIGEVAVKGNGIPRVKPGANKQAVSDFRSELSRFVENRTSRNFIPFYNPRADSSGAQEELNSLFKWLKINPESLKRMLVNNRKHSDTCLGYDIYLGLSSVNFDQAE